MLILITFAFHTSGQVVDLGVRLFENNASAKDKATHFRVVVQKYHGN